MGESVNVATVPTGAMYLTSDNTGVICLTSDNTGVMYLTSLSFYLSHFACGMESRPHRGSVRTWRNELRPTGIDSYISFSVDGVARSLMRPLRVGLWPKICVIPKRSTFPTMKQGSKLIPFLPLEFAPTTRKRRCS